MFNALKNALKAEARRHLGSLLPKTWLNTKLRSPYASARWASWVSDSHVRQTPQPWLGIFWGRTLMQPWGDAQMKRRNMNGICNQPAIWCFNGAKWLSKLALRPVLSLVHPLVNGIARESWTHDHQGYETNTKWEDLPILPSRPWIYNWIEYIKSR